MHTEGLPFVGGFYLFFSLTLGKLVPREWSQQHRGTLLSVPAASCAGGLCSVLSHPGTLAVSFKSHFHPRSAVEAEWGCFPGFLGDSSFLPPPLPSLRCLISLSQQRAIGPRGDISDVTHPLGSGCLSLFTKSWFFFLLPR